MRFKKEYLLLGLVVAALAAYLLLRDTDRTHYRLPVLDRIPTGDITRIGIQGPDGTVRLDRREGRWTVTDDRYPADDGRVRQMLAVLEQPVLTALVSKSESYDRYDLTEEKRITVQAWAGDTLMREMEVGKAAPSFKHTFVRLAGDPRVYHARDSFRFTFEGTVDNLRDKTVLDFDIGDIREIEITDNGRETRWVRKEPSDGNAAAEGEAPTAPGWKPVSGDPPDSAAVDRWLSNLDGLACDRYVYGDRPQDLGHPVYAVTLRGGGDHTLTLYKPGGSENGAYLATSSDNAYLFELTSYRAEEIVEAFRSEPEPEAETPPES